MALFRAGIHRSNIENGLSDDIMVDLGFDSLLEWRLIIVQAFSVTNPALRVTNFLGEDHFWGSLFGGLFSGQDTFAKKESYETKCKKPLRRRLMGWSLHITSVNPLYGAAYIQMYLVGMEIELLAPKTSHHLLSSLFNLNLQSNLHIELECSTYLYICSM